MASIWLLVPLLSMATAWMYFLTLIAPSVPLEKVSCALLSHYVLVLMVLLGRHCKLFTWNDFMKYIVCSWVFS